MSRKNNKKIGAIDLEKTVNALFMAYGLDVNEVVYDSMKAVADMAVSELQAHNKFSSKGHPTGAYAKSWTKTEQRTTVLSKKLIVNNEDHYRLTHLLENGHALKRGGRTYGSVKAYPHIKPVEEKVIALFERDVVERITDLKTV